MKLSNFTSTSYCDGPNVWPWTLNHGHPYIHENRHTIAISVPLKKKFKYRTVTVANQQRTESVPRVNHDGVYRTRQCGGCGSVPVHVDMSRLLNRLPRCQAPVNRSQKTPSSLSRMYVTEKMVFSDYTKQRILFFYNQGLLSTAIQKELHKESGVQDLHCFSCTYA